METRVPGFTSVLGILLLFACFSSRTEAAFDPESFQQKLVALQKVLDYMNDRPGQMNLDAAFGVTLTEANLVAALLHENVQHLEDKFFIALKEMVALSDLTRRNLMTTIAKNETRSLMLTTLNNPNLWIKPISWTRVSSRSRSSSSQLLSYWEVVRSMWHGTPNETESDQCLVKIMRSSLKEECEIPATCVATLTKEDDATGYPLTHRLLIVQVAKAMGCGEVKTASLFSLVPAYCAKILQDLVNLEAWDFPNIAQDLMMEQSADDKNTLRIESFNYGSRFERKSIMRGMIAYNMDLTIVYIYTPSAAEGLNIKIVLCGMEGYYEFVDKHFEDVILSWPHSSGCFGVSGYSNEHKITRRSSSKTDFGCDNHTTSVAAASLAVFIRENIENALSQP